MPDLFEPITIGGVRLRNRTLLPSMTTRLADDEGYVTDATVAYYLARAEGGVGLVTVEMASPEIAGKHRFRELGIYDDRFLPGLRRLVDTLHGAGAAVSVQLGHGGSRARSVVSGTSPVAPSAVPTPVFEIEHEVRCVTHPMFLRPLVNRNPAQTNRNYAMGYDEGHWMMEPSHYDDQR